MLTKHLCSPATLEAHARAAAAAAAPGPLFADAERERRVSAMRASIEEIAGALDRLGRGSPWDGQMKVSDDFLGPLFREYYRKLGLPNLMAKKSFHELAEQVPLEEIDPEVREKLDAIAEVAAAAEARRSEA